MLTVVVVPCTVRLPSMFISLLTCRLWNVLVPLVVFVLPIISPVTVKSCATFTVSRFDTPPTF